MKSDFTLTDAGVMILTLDGKLDTATSPGVEKEIGENFSRSLRWLVDMAKVDYVSSAGLRVLLQLAKKLQAADGKLAISSLNGDVLEVFEISGFSLSFDIYDRNEEALHALG